MTSLTRTRKSTGSCSGIGVVGGELEDVADLRAGELLVELGHDGAGADHVAVVLGGEARLRLAVLGAGDVDGDVVALAGVAGRP